MGFDGAHADSFRQARDALGGVERDAPRHRAERRIALILRMAGQTPLRDDRAHGRERRHGGGAWAYRSRRAFGGRDEHRSREGEGGRHEGPAAGSAAADHGVPHRGARDKEEQQHEPVDRTRISRGIVIREHDEEQRERHVAVVHGALFGALAQREIGLPPRLRGGDHLPLRRENAHPHIGNHDRAQQRPDVHECRPTGEEAAECQRDAGEEREGDCGRDPRVRGKGGAPERVVDQPPDDEESDAQRGRRAAADAGNRWVEEIGAAQVVDEDEQCDAAHPGEQGLPFEPMQHGGHFAGCRAARFDVVKPAAVDHPQVAFDAGSRRGWGAQGAVQPDEIEGAADPGDAGDEMRPAQD